MYTILPTKNNLCCWVLIKKKKKVGEFNVELQTNTVFFSKMESYFGLFTVIESQIVKVSAVTLETRQESMKKIKNKSNNFFLLNPRFIYRTPGESRTLSTS